MPSEELLKSWAVTKDHLKAARNSLTLLSDSENTEPYSHFIGEFESYFEYNELELALDMLEEASHYTHPQVGFWQNMVLAAENMELTLRAARFRKHIN